MKNIIEIREILKEHKKELKVKYKIKEIGIFGSYIKGMQKETSDIDVLVAFEKPVSLLHIVAFENYLSDMLGVKVDVVPKNNIRKEFRKNILKEAVPV
ncbi:MAG: nucleotidyltransferase family protein [Actinobacteria bacterium]|nr:nucleotidyltransferase family protein [Actinomycetota bacterium]